MTPLQRAVWDFISRDYVGFSQAAPRREIIYRFNFLRQPPAPEINDREFRSVVAELVVLFAKPICSTSAGGYFVAQHPEELDHAVAELESRGIANMERARALKKTLPLDVQRKLF